MTMTLTSDPGNKGDNPTGGKIQPIMMTMPTLNYDKPNVNVNANTINSQNHNQNEYHHLSDNIQYQYCQGRSDRDSYDEYWEDDEEDSDIDVDAVDDSDLQIHQYNNNENEQEEEEETQYFPDVKVFGFQQTLKCHDMQLARQQKDNRSNIQELNKVKQDIIKWSFNQEKRNADLKRIFEDRFRTVHREIDEFKSNTLERMDGFETTMVPLKNQLQDNETRLKKIENQMKQLTNVRAGTSSSPKYSGSSSNNMNDDNDDNENDGIQMPVLFPQLLVPIMSQRVVSEVPLAKRSERILKKEKQNSAQLSKVNSDKSKDGPNTNRDGKVNKPKSVGKSLRERCKYCKKLLTKKYMATHVKKSCPSRTRGSGTGIHKS